MQQTRRPIGRRGLIVRGAIAVGLLAILGTLFVAHATRPWFERAYLIVLENNGDAQIVGNTTDAPYLNHLIGGYGLATDWQAPGRPSYPNYLALVTGSTLGVTDDTPRDFGDPTLFDQLEAKGRTWHVYAQGYPGGCFAGEQAQGGEDLGPAGTYVRRHVPPLSFPAITGNATRCGNVTSLASFDPAGADFEMIVPNNTNNMHDGSIRAGDDWLATFVPRILESPAFAHAALFITFDEGAKDAPGAGGGLVPMIVVRPGIAPGFQSPALHTHRAFVRTIEDAWSLGCLPAVCDSRPASEFFGG